MLIIVGLKKKKMDSVGLRGTCRSTFGTTVLVLA